MMNMKAKTATSNFEEQVPGLKFGNSLPIADKGFANAVQRRSSCMVHAH